MLPARRPLADLRSWQRSALAVYDQHSSRDFLLTATPGAGKTTFALAVANKLLARRIIDRVIVVVPTDHLRNQWADAADAMAVPLDPALTNARGPVPAGYHGYVTTYAQAAAKPNLHEARATARRSLVILDEIHHAGDGLSWGEAVSAAFGGAVRRLSLTGTPFRTRPGERIPFVRYEPDGDTLVSAADFTYSYTDGLRDGVVRPVVFAAYTGTTRWRNSAGEVVAASLTEAGTKSVEQAAWRTALDPRGQWVAHVIAAMDERLTHLRANGMPDAAGLVLASDQDDARAYADVVARVTGQQPALILSDDPKASERITQFSHGTQRIAVCVRMVSEGVDVPRAACLAWLTSYRTPLFFAQAVGRVVRSRGRHESATVFLPAVRPLLALAAELEVDRNHVLKPPAAAGSGLDFDELAEPAERSSPGGDFEALEAEAQFAHVLHAGRAVTAAPEHGHNGSGADAAQDGADNSAADEDFLGLPGLLTAQQTASLFAQRDDELRRRAARSRRLPFGSGSATEGVAGSADVAAGGGAAGGGAAVDAGAGNAVNAGAGNARGDDAGQHADWRAAAELRREVNRLVAVRAARIGTPHRAVHSQLRTAVPGPASAAASIALLRARREYLLRQQ